MAFYYSRRKLKPREEEESGELNIVPYLDILMNLIIFMLMSITGLAAFGTLNVNAPSYGAPSAGTAQDNPEQLKSLSVLISKTGHFITSANGILGEEENKSSVPLKADGSYDFEALTAMMVKVKAGFGKETKVIVAAEKTTPYEVLIQTMDAIRETQGPNRQLLFPDVTLAEVGNENG